MKKLPPLIWSIRTLRKKLPKLLLLVGLEILNSFLAIGFALESKEIVNSAVAGNWTLFVQGAIIETGIILGSLLLQFLLRNMRELLMAELGREWRKIIFHSLLQGRYTAVSKYHTGELINRLSSDVRVLDDGLVNVLPGFLSMIVRICTIMAVIIAWEPSLSIVIAVAAVLMVVCTNFIRKNVNSIHRSVSECEGEIFGFQQESLENLFVIQAMEVSGEIERRSDILLNKWVELKRRKKNIFLFANTLVSILTYVIRFGTLLWGTYGIMRGAFSYGELTALLQLVAQIQAPLTNVSGILPKYTAMTVSAERLRELVEIEQEAKKVEYDISDTYEQITEIKGEDLTFSYEVDTVLEHSSFTIPKNSFAVIMGTSGIGKSTLLKLLLGMYEPNHGSLRLETHREAIEVGRHTRELFAYVPQGNLLFSGTIRENLLLIHPDVTEEQLREAIYVSTMDRYLDQLPEGLDTVLGENGEGLSEGQAQRVAIARAVLSGAPILLLDEATSALDAETELEVLERIGNLKNRTCIAVTHRPAALNKADWQLIIRDKQIFAVSVNKSEEISGYSGDQT